MDERLNWFISVDDHIIEPPDLWVDRVPKKLRDQVPHVRVEDGIEVWYYDDDRQRTAIQGFIACAGKKPGEFSPDPIPYAEMRPGYYDSAERVKDMDRDGVLASVCFPTVPRLCGQMFHAAEDKDLALRCVQVYNDWMIDEWAGAAPGRFIPLVILPLWDVDLAVREVERCAAKGAKAISFTENPHELGLPSVHDEGGYWDPLLAAVNETGLPLCVHFGSSSKVPSTSPDAPLLVSASLVTINLAFAMADWLWSGKLQEYPNLKICMSEGGIGWIPYMLERIDSVHARYKWAKDNDFRVDLKTGEMTKRESRLDLDTPPIELFRDHIYGCFIDDQFGCQNVEAIGDDNIMVETDYPHSDGTWPRSRENLHGLLAGQSEESMYKMFQGNAIRVFDFEPAPYPATVAAA